MCFLSGVFYLLRLIKYSVCNGGLNVADSGPRVVEALTKRYEKKLS